MVDGIRPGTGRLDSKALTGRLAELATQAVEKIEAAAASQDLRDTVQSGVAFDEDPADWELSELPEVPMEAHKRRTQSGGGGNGDV